MNPPDDLSAVLQKAKGNNAILGALLKLQPTVETERKIFISQIVLLHNSGEINLFSEFQKLRNNQQGPDFFLTRHIFEEALPNLQGPSLEAAKCIVHLITEGGQDFLAGTPVNAFRFFLDASPTRPAEVLALIEQDPVALSLCAKMSETSRTSIITVGRGKKSHIDKHGQDKHFYRCVGSFGA